MFGRKKPLPFKISFPLHFKDAASAVEYTSKFMTCTIIPGIELPGVVLDGVEEFNLPTAVQVRPNGIQLAAIMVCGDQQPFLVLSQTVGPIGPTLKPGDLVSWSPFKFIPEMAKQASDRRTGWAGLIVGVLRPTLLAEGWVGIERFVTLKGK